MGTCTTISALISLPGNAQCFGDTLKSLGDGSMWVHHSEGLFNGARAY